MKPTYEELEATLASVVAENAGLLNFIKDECFVYSSDTPEPVDADQCKPKTPATDRFSRELKAQGVEELADHLAGMNISVSETSVREFAQQMRADK